MLKFVNRYTIITIGVLSASFLLADDKFNDLINDEYENVSSRTAIDYNIKVVQSWRDSAWVNRAKKIKTYDDNGYLLQKDSYKYWDGDDTGVEPVPFNEWPYDAHKYNWI